MNTLPKRTAGWFAAGGCLLVAVVASRVDWNTRPQKLAGRTVRFHLAGSAEIRPRLFAIDLEAGK